MRGFLGYACAAGLALLAVTRTHAAEPAVSRIEARSANLLAVAIVRDNRMSIHLSRLSDNAPVSDAVVTVLLRGSMHPTTAQADGSYTFQSSDLAVPGAAAVEFQIMQGQQAREVLKGGIITVAEGPKSEEKNGARQLWWWVLNFAVCIGFLILLSRRRKVAKKNAAASHD